MSMHSTIRAVAGDEADATAAMDLRIKRVFGAAPAAADNQDSRRDFPTAAGETVLRKVLVELVEVRRMIMTSQTLWPDRVAAAWDAAHRALGLTSAHDVYQPRRTSHSPWQPVETCSDHGEWVWVWGGPHDEPKLKRAAGSWWRSNPLGTAPTHWAPYAPPGPPEPPAIEGRC